MKNATILKSRWENRLRHEERQKETDPQEKQYPS